MDSYNLNFEKMSNLDLHPLSLPLSRLSPAKSTSSIDQFTYHHGKGDSAYSSFSGGSNAPDYPSPFFPDDLQHHSLHYADLKYVKAIYHPNVLDSDAKSMDQLYRSMEAISNQYRNNNGCLSATQYCDQNQEKLPPPPPPPDRLDSFIATRNLENCRAQHSPEGQLADRSSPRPRTDNPDAACLRPDLVYGRRASQPYHRDTVNSDHTDKNPEQQTSRNVLSRSPPRTSQPEQHPNQQAGSAGGGHLEGHCKSVQEPSGSLLPEPPPSAIPLHVAQNMANSSIQHKGQFYFVTGVCKSSESSLNHGSLCVSEGSESPVSEPVDRERLHSTMDHMFRNTQQRNSITHDTTKNDVREFYTKRQDINSRSQDEAKQIQSRISYGPAHILNRRSHSSDALQQSLKIQSREIGRHHSPNHHIFSCGPEENCPLLSNSHNQEVPPPISMEQATHYKRDEQVNAGRRRPLGGVASQNINKENTPLLYHLTGANRAGLNLNLKLKNDIEVGMQGEDAGLNAAHQERQASVSCSDRTSQGETSKEESSEAIAHPCNTLDDSFKKYYKEKLKGAQDQVLRETSFKRSDLQLSWPHRVRQSELRPTVLHTVSSSQDSETSADTLTPSPTQSEGTDKEDIKEMLKEVEKERPANVAQPQLARIGGRRRLTPEQKELCYSEPEKLNQLGDSGEVGLLVLSGDDEELGEQGLVAARRKMFETKGRALSTSSLSKTSLQHLQHKALVAYMERKTGLKVAEPQQPAPQASQSPKQGHSMAEKPSDWGPKPQSGNKGGPKKKLYRPHSAGCVLDSSSSSMKHAQFSSSQSRGHSHQASWRESTSPSQGKSASEESLLDQPEPLELFRNRFTSTPHVFQGHNYMNDPSPVNAMDTSSAQTQRPVDEESVVVRRDQAKIVRVMGRRVRMVVKRGKSLEELGVSQVSSSSVLSKTSEQLGQHHSRQGAPGPGQEKSSVPSFSETQRKPLFKQDSAPQLGSREKSREMTKSTRESTTSNSPVSNTSSQVRARSDGSPGSYNFVPLVKEVVETTRLSCDVPLPPYLNGQQSSERLVKSTSTFPSIHTHPRGTGGSKTGSNSVKTAPPIQHTMEREQSVDEPIETLQPEASQEVSLSCGVTTDPTLWVIPPEPGSQVEDEGPALSDNLTEGETPTLACATAASEPLTTSSTTPVPDTDTCQSGEGQHPGEDEETPAGETESPEKTPTTEDTKWEELVEEVVTTDQSLARVLYPLTNRKTVLMLMEQLLSEDTLLMEEYYKKKQRDIMTLHAADGSKTVDDPEAPPTSPVDEKVQPQPEPQSKMDVTEKKRLLVTCIEERLLALEEPRGALQVEVKENGLRGEAVEALVREHCTAVEVERYCLFVGDLERVVSLLLCLSARLARVQNALSTVDQHTEAEEKDSLDNRHRLLCKQREDAKDLKDNLDRREQMVSNFLSRCLTAEQLQDYRHFVQTKASLLIRMKDLDETQRLGEEQLESLLNTLPP